MPPATTYNLNPDLLKKKMKKREGRTSSEIRRKDPIPILQEESELNSVENDYS